VQGRVAGPILLECWPRWKNLTPNDANAPKTAHSVMPP
jgi:hypothetical protein